VALSCIPDANRSTAVNFVDVNGRSLYIVDWRMVVVEGGNVLHHVKRLSERGKCPGGNMSGGSECVCSFLTAHQHKKGYLVHAIQGLYDG